MLRGPGNRKTTVMKIFNLAILILLWQAVLVAETLDAAQILDAALHHVRNGTGPEWSEFDGPPESTSYQLKFEGNAADSEQTLRIAQHDVKQLWSIELNGKKLGRLHREIFKYQTTPLGERRTGRRCGILLW